eukprot:5409278-Pleurochrysis_carterae.AAC.1
MSLNGALCARLRSLQAKTVRLAFNTRLRSSQAKTVRLAFNRLNRLYGTTLRWPSGTASPSLAALALAWRVTKVGDESP